MNLNKAKNMPGTAFWRLFNYGAIGTLNYVLFEKAFKRKKPDFRSIETSSVAVTKFLNLDQKEFDFISRFVDEYLADCETILISNGIEIKFGTVGKHSPKNRLYAIGLAVIAFKPNTYIETGTQHGVSAGFVEKLSETLEMKIKVFSFDVYEQLKIIPGFSFERILLKKPVRKNLVKSLYHLKLENDKIIFFHDSDHSFENMYSEFKIAQKILDPVAIISDDISLNKSFLKFCKREKFKYKQFRISSGNAAGIAFKNTCDPDGT